MRYAKGTHSISASRDIPLLVHVRNSKFITHQQLFELAQLAACDHSRERFNWRVKRLVHAGDFPASQGNFGTRALVYPIARPRLSPVGNPVKVTTSFNMANEMWGIRRRLAFATSAAFRKDLLDTMVLTCPDELESPFRSQLHGIF